LAQTPEEEIKLRNAFNFQRSGQNSGVAVVNWTRYTTHVIYSKGYNQLANKIKRVTNKNNIGVTELHYLREILKTEKNKIRIETQLKSEEAINDFFNYQKHDVMIEIIHHILAFVKETIANEDPIIQVKSLIKTLDNPSEYPKLHKSLLWYYHVLREEVKLMQKYKLPENIEFEVKDNNFELKSEPPPLKQWF